jgi:hypothetical protein
MPYNPSIKLLPFFCFYGGKYRAAPHYPAPQFNTIVEPFAGAAGYSLRHHTLNVILIEKDPVIANLWRYLITETEAEILKLPLLGPMDNLQDFPISDNAKSLIGFWLNKGSTSPAHRPSAWMRGGLRPHSFWGETIRLRIAQQLKYIRHWKIILGDYSVADNTPATWFVDPPYQLAGRLYKYSSRFIDYAKLGRWCQSRKGQLIVCENEGATWLPFLPFRSIKSTEGSRGGKRSEESIFLSHQNENHFNSP